MEARERVIRKWIKEQVLRAGRSEWFADQAGDYPEMYKGDVARFITEVDAQMAKEERAENRAGTRGGGFAGSRMDEGVKRVEKEYTGDVLTYWGYDVDTESGRW